MVSVSRKGSQGEYGTTTWPNASIPRRPARPAICWNSFGISTRRRRPSHLLIRPITTVRAGMLTPSARVSVAKTTCINPRPKSTSTSCLRIGSNPAWWKPIPRRASRVMSLTCSSSRSSGRKAARVELEHRLDADFLRFVDQFRPHRGQPLGKNLAIVAAEEEVDGREHVARSEIIDDLVRLRLVHHWSVLLGTTPLGCSTADLPSRFPADMRESLDDIALWIDHQVQLAVDEVVERERHRPFVVGDQPDRPVGAPDPGGDLVGIGDGGREADELQCPGRG